MKDKPITFKPFTGKIVKAHFMSWDFVTRSGATFSAIIYEHNGADVFAADNNYGNPIAHYWYHKYPNDTLKKLKKFFSNGYADDGYRIIDGPGWELTLYNSDGEAFYYNNNGYYGEALALFEKLTSFAYKEMREQDNIKNQRIY